MISNTNFVKACADITNMKTLYVLGGFGIVLNSAGKEQVKRAYNYNAQRASMINNVDNETFGFDCSGMIKGVLWGFTGNVKQTYGGAVYQSNGVPDLNTAGIWDMCKDKRLSVIPDEIVPGEYLYMDGHCGVYYGDGKVIECSPAWKNRVQITELTQRAWIGHGKLPWVMYEQNADLKSALAELENAINKVKGYL